METYYKVGLDARTRPSLSEDRTVDAVVVGAGFAGVAAAHEFARQGLGVLLIEKEQVGGDASGRNGGILLTGHGHHLNESADSDDVIDPQVAVVQEFHDAIETHGIDAEVRHGTVRLARTKRQAESLRKMARPGRSTFLEGAALREAVASARYSGGLLEPDGLVLNPLKLLEGLAKTAEADGVEIVEHTTVLDVRAQPNGTTVVRTDNGTVTARRVVLAVGSALDRLVPATRGRLLKAYTHIGVTEHLGADVLASVIRPDLAFSEVTVYSRYFRAVDGDRLLFGISTVLDPVADGDLPGAILREMHDTFPQLGDVRLDFAWPGLVASTREETPWLGRFGPTGVFINCNGVLPSWQAGGVAARATAPEFAEYDELRNDRPGAWPPLGLPDWLVRLGGKVVLKAQDRW